MSDRRFTDKPELNPDAVRPLADDHPALVGNRTLFPSTVVEVTQDTPDRLLISGDNNRKIGATVEKGAFKGYSIFMLSLEERATCPSDCEARAYCYGNGMQLARRHKIGDSEAFYDRLGLEIAELANKHEGVLIRLHVLGDFPSVEYVAFWKEVLDEYPNVACFGYTHRSPVTWGGDDIGDAIQAAKDVHLDRFRIRWSSPVSRADGAIVIDFVPQKPKTVNGEIVCPSQTDATACCATCALCWDKSTARDCIAFIKHGPKSPELEASKAMAVAVKEYRTELNKIVEEIGPKAPVTVPLVAENPPEEINGDRRRIRGIMIPFKDKLKVAAPAMPEMRTVEPSTLIVEASYQRDLSGKSLKLIRSIVLKWDWAKFKPPVCAETPEGLFVIDGQHTAIAAASHPGVAKIPVMVVQRPDIEDRAAAFVSQNRDRLVMSPLQVFHAELVAGDKTALGILRCVVKAGGSVPRAVPQKGKAKPGEMISMSALRHLYASGKPDHMERVLRIAVLSGQAPAASTLLRGLDLALRNHTVFGEVPLRDLEDAEIANAVGKIEDVEKTAEGVAADAETSKYDALAGYIAYMIEEHADADAEVLGKVPDEAA